MIEGQERIHELLEHSHLFKTLDEAGRKRLEASGGLVQVKPGEVLIREGTEGDSFYILLDGKVKVTSQKDGKPILLAELARGAVLGEVALLTGEARTASVTALEASTLVRFPEGEVLDILDAYPKVKELLARILVHRAKDTIEKLSREPNVS